MRARCEEWRSCKMLCALMMLALGVGSVVTAAFMDSRNAA